MKIFVLTFVLPSYYCKEPIIGNQFCPRLSADDGLRKHIQWIKKLEHLLDNKKVFFFAGKNGSKRATPVNQK